MSKYVGTITTTGKSEAIRLEKALFKSHPEFRQRAKVHAHVIGPGTMLVSVAEKPASASEIDPVMSAFLRFLEADILNNPGRLKSLSETRIKDARRLTKGMKVSDDEVTPDDVTL